MQPASCFIKKITRYPLQLRFFTAIIIPAILVILSAFIGLFNLYKQYEFTTKEIRGTHTINHLFHSLIELQKIRGLTQISLWDQSEGIKSQLLVTKAHFANHFDDTQYQKSNAEFTIQNEIDQIRTGVNTLINLDNNAINAHEIFTKYSQLIGKLHEALLIVADRSNLILDPELDTYYMIEIAVKQVPNIVEAIGILRGIGGRIIAREGFNSQDEKLFQEGLSVFHNESEKLKRAKSIIRYLLPDIITSLKANQKSYNKIKKSVEQACATIEKGGQSKLSAQDFFKLSTELVEYYNRIYYINTSNLEDRLKQRVLKLRLMIITILSATIFTLSAVFYFAISFYQRERQSYHKLERLSFTDPLTNIPNRRHLNFVVPRELKRLHREGKGMAFCILDIDYFKRYNDTYGHQEGDLALQNVAEAIKNSLKRPSDYFFRFGGEEFCFLVGAASLSEAEKVGEIVRAAVEQLQIEHRENSVIPFVTISLGVAYLPKIANEDLDFLIKQSDQALYEAKDQGRNRCVTVTIST